MKKFSLIIVENDQDEQLFMKEAILSEGLFDLLTAVRNGDTLFDFLSQSKKLPDVILSDLNMPGKNGYDIIAGIKSNPAYAHIPVLITSTAASPSTIQKCMSAGAAGYMVKPDTFIDYAEFFAELHALIIDKKILTV